MDKAYVYIVTHERGDGYHLIGVSLLRAFLLEDDAEAFVKARPDQGLQVEAVPFAPQTTD